MRWYLRYALSCRDVEELLQERGVWADHTTVFRWVQRDVPDLDKRCGLQLKAINDSYHVDKTYRCCRRIHEGLMLPSRSIASNQRFQVALDNSPTVSLHEDQKALVLSLPRCGFHGCDAGLHAEPDTRCRRGGAILPPSTLGLTYAHTPCHHCGPECRVSTRFRGPQQEGMLPAPCVLSSTLSI